MYIRHAHVVSRKSIEIDVYVCIYGSGTYIHDQDFSRTEEASFEECKSILNISIKHPLFKDTGFSLNPPKHAIEHVPKL